MEDNSIFLLNWVGQLEKGPKFDEKSKSVGCLEQKQREIGAVLPSDWVYHEGD
jgi:hypothetical protein